MRNINPVGHVKHNREYMATNRWNTTGLDTNTNTMISLWEGNGAKNLATAQAADPTSIEIPALVIITPPQQWI
jgi:hypothetical protein